MPRRFVPRLAADAGDAGLVRMFGGAGANGRAEQDRFRLHRKRLMTESKMAKAADAKIEAEFSKRQKAIEDHDQRSFKTACPTNMAITKSATPGRSSERVKRERVNGTDLEKDLQRAQREFREDLIQRKSEERASIAAKGLQADRTDRRTGKARYRAAGIGLVQPAHRYHRQDPQAAG